MRAMPISAARTSTLQTPIMHGMRGQYSMGTHAFSLVFMEPCLSGKIRHKQCTVIAGGVSRPLLRADR